MPVRTGRVLWGVVVRDLHKVLPVLVKYMRCETDSSGVPASSEGNVIVIDTSGVGKGDGGWNDRVLSGLFKMLASTVAHTYSIKKNELGHIENNLKMMLQVSVVATRRSFAYETANNLLAFVAALIGAPNDAAQRALLDANSSDWRKAHFPDKFRHLLRRLLVARGFGIMIRIKHRFVSSGFLLAATSYVHQSFHEEPEHEVRFPAVSSVLLSHWMARIYPDMYGYIPDFAEKPGF